MNEWLYLTIAYLCYFTLKFRTVTHKMRHLKLCQTHFDLLAWYHPKINQNIVKLQGRSSHQYLRQIHCWPVCNLCDIWN